MGTIYFPHCPSPEHLSRFLKKIKPGSEHGCWIWGASTRKGYGQITVNCKNRPAHKLAYEWCYGPVPAGMHLDHIVCDTPLCVNPTHMRVGTCAENVLRGGCPPAINKRKTHCHKGHEFSPENTLPKSNGGRACRLCSRASEKKYRDKNKEARNAKSVEYHWLNREKILARKAAYRAKALRRAAEQQPPE